MAESNLLILLPAILVVVALGALLVLLARTRAGADEEAKEATSTEATAAEEEERGPARSASSRRRVPARIRERTLRQRRALGRAVDEPSTAEGLQAGASTERAAPPVEESVEDEGPLGDTDAADTTLSDEDAADGDVEAEAPRAGKLKKKKEAHKEAKRERAAAQQAAIQAQKERQEAEAERRQQIDEEREAREREREEEAKRLQEEREAKEQAEFDKWKGSFVVESAGSGEADLGVESQGLLAEFIEYIRTHKVIVLEELASHFKLRTEDVIKRVNELESSGTITGVFDDRGKFIFIEESEMQAVAEFMKRRGRVSIAELSVEAGKLVNLTAG